MVADRADALEIVCDRRHGAGGRPDDRLGEESDDAVRADLKELVLERLGGARRIVRFALSVPLEPIGVTGFDVMGLDQQGSNQARRRALPPAASAPSVLPW